MNPTFQRTLIRRRVVITGLGLVTPLGLDVASTWAGLIEGRSGIGPITRFDAAKSPVKIAGEIKGFKPQGWLNTKEVRKMGLFIQYALTATEEALKDAGLKIPFSESHAPHPQRVGVNVSAGMGGLPEIEYWSRELATKDKKVISPFFVPMIIPNLSGGHISIFTNAQGPNLCIVTACASSSHAIGESFRHIQEGRSDVIIAGGSEAVICETGVVGFASMKALSTRNEDPQRASRPYDKDRDGFVLSEGAGVLILEELEHAKKRGAKIYGEILGYGANADAYHMTSPAPEGRGARRCMEIALEDAGLTPAHIDYINTHGTSTPTGDGLEATAIGHLFKDHKDKLHVSSTKSMTGHILGAAGAVEAIVSTLALRNGIVPPTINLDDVDEECRATGLNFTPHKAVQKNIRYILSNSFGFGGTNAALIIGQYES